jgi:serine/threonine protein kinase
MATNMESSFPQPTILKASVGLGYIMESPNQAFTDYESMEKANVLSSSSGARYEMGRTLKKSIYGVVIHATLLSPVIPSSSHGAHSQSSSPKDTQSPSNGHQSQQQQNHPKFFTRTNLSYAIKVYSKELIYLHSSRSKENPLNELSALQYLGDEHPNLIGSIEICSDLNYIYSIMRFCSGGELFDYILTNGKVNESEAKLIFYHLLQGLQILQEKGIAHLDISLENILYNSVNGFNQIMIIDFGMCHKLTQVQEEDEETATRMEEEDCFCPNPSSSIFNFSASAILNHLPSLKAPVSPTSTSLNPNSANITPVLQGLSMKSTKSSTSGKTSCSSSSQFSKKYEKISNNHCGKRNYMAPEIIADNENIDAISCDIWSAGICLLYLLLGFPPLEIAALNDIRYSYVVQGNLKELLDHWNISLSEEVIDLLSKILKERPEERLTLEEILNHSWLDDVYNQNNRIKRAYSVTSQPNCGDYFPPSLSLPPSPQPVHKYLKRKTHFSHLQQNEQSSDSQQGTPRGDASDVVMAVCDSNNNSNNNFRGDSDDFAVSVKGKVYEKPVGQMKTLSLLY